MCFHDFINFVLELRLLALVKGIFFSAREIVMVDELKKLYSFDIFDTLITRRVATPPGIFAIMQSVISNQTNLSPFIKDNFYRIRIETENLVRKCIFRKFQFEEITFDEIYADIQHNYNLSSAEIEFLKNLEITTEINNILPIEENISKLKELIYNGERVVLISDMYLSEDIIRNILVNVDSIFKNIKIYVSSEYRVKKSKGNLYLKVQEEENADFANWIHTGDNKNGDIKQAEILGITAQYYAPHALMSYEKYLLKDNYDNVFYQATVGSARLARFNICVQNQGKYNFGASFAAPVLFNYVDYVIQQALERNFKTLYFVARDGYIPKLIADTIISKRNLNIKTKYIYGSRLAWKVPTEDNFEEFIDRIFEEYKKFFEIPLVSVPLGINADKLCEILDIQNVNQKFDKEQQEYLLNKIKSSPEIRQIIITSNTTKKNMLIDYFKQEIDLTESNVAFVDLDGSGKTQDIVSELLNTISDCNVYYFYFTNPLMEQKDRSIKICYGMHRPYFYWIELLGRTVYGQTVGYKYKNGKVVPILEPGFGKIMADWGYDEYLNGVLTYTSTILDAELQNRMCYSHIDIYCRYFNYIYKNLDRKTADILGSIPCCHVGSENSLKYSSPPYKFFDLIANYVCNGSYIQNLSYLPFVSLARSSKKVKQFVAFKNKYPRISDFLFKLNVNKVSKKANIEICGLKVSLNSLYRSVVR